MSSTHKYIEFLKINLTHDYFDNIIPIELIFEDFSIIKNFEIIVKRKQNNWIIYGRDSRLEDFKNTFSSINFQLNPQITLDKNDKKENDSVLRFIIKPLDPIFYYVTSFLKNNQFTNKNLLNVKLDSLEKYYEYILFFKNDNINEKNIEIIDSLKTIGFNNSKIISYNNGQKALHFQSKGKVKLTRKSTCYLKIVNKSEYGDKILFDNIKIPQPQSISTLSPHEAITTFYNI